MGNNTNVNGLNMITDKATVIKVNKTTYMLLPARVRRAMCMRENKTGYPMRAYKVGRIVHIELRT